MLNYIFHLDFSGTPASSINGSILIPFIVICLGLIVGAGLKRRWGFIKTVFVASFALYLFTLMEILFFSIPFIPHEIVEAVQFIGSFVIFKISWKVVDIDDVIMNILGGMIGLTGYLIVEKLFKARQVDNVT